MNEPSIQITGTACADAALRYTPNGKPVTVVTVACNPRRQDPKTGEWTDGTATFWTCQVWGPMAEHAAESVRKGDRVNVEGKIRANVWTPTDGPQAGVEQRRMDVVVDEIALSLRFKPARVSAGASRATAEQAPFEVGTAEEAPF